MTHRSIPKATPHGLVWDRTPGDTYAYAAFYEPEDGSGVEPEWTRNVPHPDQAAHEGHAWALAMAVETGTPHRYTVVRYGNYGRGEQDGEYEGATGVVTPPPV